MNELITGERFEYKRESGHRVVCGTTEWGLMCLLYNEEGRMIDSRKMPGDLADLTQEQVDAAFAGAPD